MQNLIVRGKDRIRSRNEIGDRSREALGLPLLVGEVVAFRLPRAVREEALERKVG